MSVKELWLERRVAQHTHQQERDRDLILAWQIMRIKLQTQNAKRLPTLRSLLEPHHPPGPGSQKAALYQLSATLGIPVTRVPRGERSR